MNIDFESYIRGDEPEKKEKAYAWKTAIGLQAVDGLKTSNYLKNTARKHIEGDINIDEVKKLINGYYKSKTVHTSEDEETEEADKVSANIARILNEQSFAFSFTGFTSVHRRLFEGIFNFAGKIRDYDITKKEWVLRGDTVLYVNAEDLRKALEYDLEQEKNFLYKGLSMDEVVNHIGKFVSGIWQIHPFGEGNTRTTAVFTIKYLRSIGFNVNNNLFADNSWYFRNALVRANYRNVRTGIEPDMSFLISFFRNLMMGESNELKNRYMVIDAPNEWTLKQHPTSARQAPDKLTTSSPAILNLINVLGEQQLSIKDMLTAMRLKDRENFMKNYLYPAMKEDFVVMLYPNNSRHPRQKYLLTVSGLAIYNSSDSCNLQITM
ncbi:MAG: Fic family protein [Prolixibacteraceae bacterium]|nr:Fic family protein [Prolixibacteraceae bacterium]